VKKRMASFRMYAGFSSSCVSTTSIGNLALASKSQRVFEVSPSQAGRIGNHGEHLAAKHVVRHPGRKGGVTPPE